MTVKQNNTKQPQKYIAIGLEFDITKYFGIILMICIVKFLS